jgi:hypothetical protein
MAYYVYALVDERPAGRLGRGLGGAVSLRAVPGGFAVLERRADVPPAEFGTLKTHDALVAAVAHRVPAILPLRFGTLLELEEIEAALQDREEELAEAFALVRNRMQFTWRRRTPVAHKTAAAATARAVAGRITPGTGTAYLRRAARAASPSPPAVFRICREKLRPLIVQERYQPATASLPDSLYHLVDRASAARYRLVAEKLASSTPALRVTGPWAPFAFTPDLL